MAPFRLRNSEGTPVDPVPLFVVVLTAFLVTHAWGPLYLAEFGFSTVGSLTLVTVVFLAVSGVAYHRLVWTNYPDRRAFVGPQPLSWILYGVAIGIALVVLLSIPFLA